MTRVTRAIATAMTIALVGFGCGDSAPANRENNPRESRDGNVLEWEVVSTTPPRTLRVGGAVEYCLGDPQPIIGRPQIRYRGDDIYMRLRLEISRKKRAKKGNCAGVERFVRKAITLRRDLSDVNVYDSGIESPELRWP
jgi:hypothetical protein